MANFLTKAFKGISESLGFSKPKIPDSAVPQVDPIKRDIGGKLGAYFTNQMNGGLQRADQEYVMPQQMTAIQTKGTPLPTQSNEANRQIAYQPTQESQRALPLPAQQEGNVQLSGQGAGAVTEALNRVRAVAAPTQEGYDPQRKAMAIETLNRQLGNAESEATRAANERLSRSGIANSTVGAKAIGKIASDIAGQRADALRALESEDLAAQREDRYRNLGITREIANQLASLGESSQGVDMRAAQFGREGRTMDTAQQQRAAEFGRQGNQIDLENAMQMANFARQGGQMDKADEWQRYAATLAQNIGEAQEGRRVQEYNLQAADTGQQRKENRFNTELGRILAYLSGSPYTPESEAQALKTQMATQEQSKRQGATSGLLGTLLGGLFG